MNNYFMRKKYLIFQQSISRVLLNSMKKEGDSNKRARGDDDGTTVVVGPNDPPLTLPNIQIRIRQLLDSIPSKNDTSTLTVDDLPAMENWCRTVRGIVRNYNLTLNFVAISNYQWEPDRPGHTGQSLGALRNQISLSTAQTNILNNHIGRVLTPTLDRQVVKKKTKTFANGDKEESYEYENIVNDPELLALNRLQLCDEAIYKRQLLVSTMEQMIQCMDDYLKAEAGATGQDGQRFSMAY